MLKKMKRTLISIVFALALVIGLMPMLTLPAKAAAGDTWAVRTSGVDADLNGICYGGSTFVAVGAGGTILTSSDGTSWTNQTSKNIGVTGGANLNAVCYGNSMFMAVGTGGKVITSTDGATWTSKNNSLTNLVAVAYGLCGSSNTFVAVDSYGNLFTSTNGGTTWSKTFTSITYIYGICYGNGQFVVVGDYWFPPSAEDVCSIILTSSDGSSWTDHSSINSAQALNSVCYGNSQYVACDIESSVLTSADGVSWTNLGYWLDTNGSHSLDAVCYGGTTYVTVGSGGILYVSTNGTSWTLKDSKTTNYLKGVSYGNGTFVAVGASGTITTSGGSSAPTVTSVSPTSGTTAGGTSVTITGTNFTNVSDVKFGSTSSVGFTVMSPNQIIATSPAHAAGVIDITVIAAGGTSATGSADQFTYVPAPTVTGISPKSGVTAGGTTVVITGTNFTGASAVKFGLTAAEFAIDSATQITAKSPAGSAGTVDITVTTAGGTSLTSSADWFTYAAAPTVTAVSPSSGPTTGGTSVTITGTNFTGATAVKFGSTAATFTVNSATKITATSPAGSGTVDITVTTAGGTSTTGLADKFTYNTAPSVSTPTAASYTDTAAMDAFSNTAGTLSATDPEGSAVTYGITGGTTGGSTTISGTTYDVSKAGSYGNLYVKSTTGAYVFVPNANEINGLSAIASETYTVTASDGSLSGTAVFTVNITAVNDTPAFLSAPAAAIYTDTAASDTFSNSKGTMSANDAEFSTLTYGIAGGATGGSTTISGTAYDVSKAGNYGTLFVVSTTGGYVFVPNSAAINERSSNTSETFTVTAYDGSLSGTATFTVNIIAANDKPVITITGAATDITYNGNGTISVSGTLTDADKQSVTVSATIDGKTRSTIIDTSSTNSWTLTWSVKDLGISENTYTNISFVADDGSGGTASAAYTGHITVDPSAPTVTIVAGSTAGGDALVSGAEKAAGFNVVARSSEGNCTLYVVPSGTANDIGAIGTAAIACQGSAAAGSDTTIPIPIADPLVINGTSYCVYAVDAAGNVSTISNIAFTVDTTGPNTIASACVFSADTGTSRTDFKTNTAPQTISGTLNANLSAGETVYVSLDNGGTWSKATASVGSDTWSISATLTASNTLKVKVTDLAGNDGAVYSQAYVLDTVAPTVTDLRINITGGTGTGGAFKIGDTVIATWNNTTSGDNNGDVVGVTVDFSAFGGGSSEPATNGSGTWTATFKITAGSIDGTGRNISVTATDNAGNSTTTIDSSNAIVDNIAPTVTDANITISGASGTGGVYKVGDIVTAVWNNTASGDNNVDTIASVTFNFSQFGGGSAVAATNYSGVWRAEYTIVSGNISASNVNVSVTATDNAGNVTTIVDSTNATVNNSAPKVTDDNISISGATGTDGAFKIGDTVTATWNNTAYGDNNSDISGVTVDFSAFGGGTAVTATDSSGTWTAKYIITAGLIDGTNKNISVTARNSAGNAETTTDTTNATVDNIAPKLTDARISIAGATGTGGTFKIGDTIFATWNNTTSGDNNGDIAGVMVDFSAFGGGSWVMATNSSGTWTASYTIIQGSIDGANKNISVTATDNAGNSTTTADTTYTLLDNIAPTVTDANISIGGASGNGGVYKVGDIVTAIWNNTASGNNNSDTMVSVTFNFSQFGGGSAVAATNYSGVWKAEYTIVSGNISASNINVSVTVTDNAGNVTTMADSSNASIDNILPDTSITHTPSSVSNETSPSFTFTSSETATFEASLDSGTYVAVTNPLNLEGMAAGSHTLSVRAIDSAGNIDPSPASYTWTIDTNNPSVTISTSAANPTNTSPIPVNIEFSKPVTGFASGDVYVVNGSVTLFSVVPESNNKSYTATITPDGDGEVTVSISAGVAADAAGNENTAAAPLTRTFDRTSPSAPTVTSSRATTTDSTPTWTWTSGTGDGIRTYRYKLDSSDLTSGATETEENSYTPSSALNEGEHTLYVQERDEAGNWSLSGSYKLTIDIVEPTVTTANVVLDDSNATLVTLGGTVTDDGGAAVSVRGVVYKASETPVMPRIGDPGVTKVEIGSDTGSFSSVYSLSPGTKYYVCAYATNNIGTSYGDSVNFTTHSGTPFISSIAPVTGPLSGGTYVTITGTNFIEVSSVKFGTQNASSYKVNSATEIIAVSPQAETGTVDIIVTTSYGTSNAKPFIYTNAPTITAVSPSAGPLSGETSVTITGANFTEVSGVYFGNSSALSYTVNSATQIIAVSPPGSAGIAHIKVTAIGGQSIESSADQYTYAAAPTVTSISPTSGAGGTSVTITGTNFIGVSGVYFGSTPATYTVNSDTQIIAVSPNDSGTVDVTVTAAGGTSSANSAAQYTYPSSGGNGGGSTPPTTPTTPDTGTNVIVNGETKTAGSTSTSTNADGKTVTTVTVDTAKLETILTAADSGATVIIPVAAKTDVAEGVLTGQMVKSMEEKDATLIIKTESVSYTLPASQINIDSVSQQLGSNVSLSDIKVSVQVSEPPANTVRIVEDTASKGNYTVVVKPVDFSITCTHSGQTVEVSKFNGYVERTVAIPDGVDPSKITTGVVLNSDGTFSHVPTQIIIIDGKYYAKINSLTNSTYTVVWHPLEFPDLSGHWAKNEINDMGSRLVVNGDEKGNYNPDNNITRSEFAAIIVRALGLRPGSGDDSFSDVKSTDWYFGYVQTAASYGIIKGYDLKTFGPNDLITREQAMTMIGRAMKITKLDSGLSNAAALNLLQSFADAESVSDYAKDSIANCISTGVVNGREGRRVAPKDFVTRAEVAVMAERLLKKSGLI